LGQCLVASGWSHAERYHSTGDVQWSDFHPAFVSKIRDSFPQLPPAAVALAFRVWGRMHGLVALEVYGHLHPQVQEPARLYDAELVDLARTIGLGPP
jgi:Tetracyclin repressor-like, C-terminal domain